MPTTSQKALKLIKHFESLHDGDLTKVGLQPKLCPAGIWTVGYGKALRHPKTGRFLKGAADKALAYSLFPNLTEAQAEMMLMDDLKSTYEPRVVNQITKKTLGTLNDDQFGSLTSFMYNCGEGKPLYRIWGNVNRGISGEALFQYWASSVIKGGGKILPGLVRRRKAEAYLYTNGILKLDW